MIDQLTIIGVGLIGGSIARAARKHKLCRTIVGYGRNPQEMQKALELGVVDESAGSAAEAVADAEMVVIAVPIGAMRAVMQEIKGSVRDDAVITDVGSAKVSVVHDAQAIFGKLPEGFVPGHPIAGTERSGVEASFAELYQNRCFIMTPGETTAPWAVEKVRRLWEGMGSQVVAMDAAHHDEVLAATSHLPHVLAFALVDTLGQMHERKEIFQFAAGGFRDFTRIASSDPDMWRDICLANGDAILHVLDLFKKELDALASAIESRDGARIETVLRRAKRIRDKNVVV